MDIASIVPINIDPVERRGCRVVDGELEPRRGHRASPACQRETPQSCGGQRFHNVTNRVHLTCTPGSVGAPGSNPWSDPAHAPAEEGELAGNRNRGTVRECSLPSADVVEDQLRDVGVVTDDDEDGRSLVAGPFRLALLPLAIAGFIVAVEAMESPLQLDRQLGLASDRFGSPAPAGKLLADSRPEVAVGRLIPLHRVVGDGNAGNLDDARLDGVDEREVGDDPGKEVAFPIARAAEEEGGRRQVVEAADADLIAMRVSPGFDAALTSPSQVLIQLSPTFSAA